MTKQQIDKKIIRMLKEVKKYLLTETTRLHNSGAIDIEKYGNNFFVPKILLHVSLLNCAHQYRPLDVSESVLANIENLKHF